MWNKQWESVDFFLKKWNMVQEGDSILLGISGGADSICLARYFLAKRESMSLKLYAVHINHMLRGAEAKRDEEFVRSFCESRKLPLDVEYRNIREESRKKKCSEEEAGRIARYECFEKYAKKYHCGKIAVAHHQNDAAETILFRMLRGTGAQGMAGIHPVNGKLIRPFLCLSREDITDVLKDIGQDYVDDSTNGSEEYSRNYIRHRILPEMKSVNNKAVEHISEFGMQMQELLSYITPKLELLYKESVRVSAKGELFLPENIFLKVSLFEQKELLRRMLFEVSGHQKDISLIHVEQLLALMKNREGKKQNCPYGVLARRVRDGLILVKEKDGSKTSDLDESKMKPIYLELPADSEDTQQTVSERNIFCLDKQLEVRYCVLPWNGGKVVKKDCVKYFDYDKMKCKPCLRTRDTGDYFIMDKEGRRKSLGRYFIDTKIPASDRDGKLLLADGSHILWIIGGRISEFYKVSSETKRVLRVSVQRDKDN